MKPQFSLTLLAAGLILPASAHAQWSLFEDWESYELTSDVLDIVANPQFLADSDPNAYTDWTLNNINRDPPEWSISLDPLDSSNKIAERTRFESPPLSKDLPQPIVAGTKTTLFTRVYSPTPFGADKVGIVFGVGNGNPNNPPSGDGFDAFDGLIRVSNDTNGGGFAGISVDIRDGGTYVKTPEPNGPPPLDTWINVWLVIDLTDPLLTNPGVDQSTTVANRKATVYWSTGESVDAVLGTARTGSFRTSTTNPEIVDVGRLIIRGEPQETPDNPLLDSIYIDYSGVNLTNPFGVTGTPGDFNVDGFVDAADYVLWRKYLNSPSEVNIGNNGDGLNGVNADDYELWRKRFGAVGSGAASALVVPEPAAAFLILIGIAAIGFGRRAPR